MIGKIIRKRRKAKGLSYLKLGRLSGHPPSSISNIEYGIVKNPSFHIIYDIAKVLGISLDELGALLYENKNHTEAQNETDNS